MNMHTPSKAARNLKKLEEVRALLRSIDAQLVHDIVRLNDHRPAVNNGIVTWSKYADELTRIANTIKRGER